MRVITKRHTTISFYKTKKKRHMIEPIDHRKYIHMKMNNLLGILYLKDGQAVNVKLVYIHFNYQLSLLFVFNEKKLFF
jgi:hypothetical protein